MKVILWIALFAFTATNAQQKVTGNNDTRVITYNESKEDFPNPERGFYIPVGTSSTHFHPLETAQLKQLFAGPQKHGKATYAIYSTLLMREYTLDTFRQRALSADMLDKIDHDLSVIEEAGLKVILRFAYTSHSNSGNCPDIYKICPPYGDAPKAIVLMHIGQLAPLFRKHAAVIAVVQEGFIGIWGEGYYTDYFGDAGRNGPGRIMDSSWKDRNDVLRALLQALPDDRIIQVRTPQIKQKYVYGPEARTDAKPMSVRDAFSGKDASRLGFHNDCFLAGPDDYGTYYDNGSSTQPEKEANVPLRKYLEADSRYLPVGGETCDDVYSPANDCAPVGHAEEEMAGMHFSFLNTTYNNDVNNDWDSLGCISSIRQKLGYRLVLREGRFPSHVKSGGSFPFTIRLRNVGYASPYNPRAVSLVFRNTGDGKEIILPCQADPRKWFSGDIEWKEELRLPAGMAPGEYQLFLSFPDKYPSLAGRPEYSIQLANKDCWEAATGYNKLGVSLTAF